MRAEPREGTPLWLVVFAPVAAVLAALLLCSFLILWAGESVGQAYGLLAKGAFGSRFALTETSSRKPRPSGVNSIFPSSGNSSTATDSVA